jgi:hypothetical protein
MENQRIARFGKNESGCQISGETLRIVDERIDGLFAGYSTIYIDR